MQLTDGICKPCAIRVIEPIAVSSPTPRRRDGDREAALFVGLPLTVALVLAATPLSEPPMRPNASTRPAALTATASPSRAQAAGMEAAIVAPRLMPATGGGRGVRIARVRPLAARAMLVAANGVERVEIQAP